MLFRTLNTNIRSLYLAFMQIFSYFNSVFVVYLLVLSLFSCSVVSDSLWPPRTVARQASLSITNSPRFTQTCPLSPWCHPTTSSSVIPFFSHLQSFLVSGSFQMSHLFASGGQSSGFSASASVICMNIQGWFPVGWTGWISLQFKGLSRVFSNTTVEKHQFRIILYKSMSLVFFT